MLVLTLTSLVVRVRPSTVSRQEFCEWRRFGRNFKLKKHVADLSIVRHAFGEQSKEQWHKKRHTRPGPSSEEERSVP